MQYLELMAATLNIPVVDAAIIAYAAVAVPLSCVLTWMAWKRGSSSE